LHRVFSLQFERTVNRDNTVRLQNLTLQIEAVKWRGRLARCSVTAHQHLDGTLSLSYGPRCLGRYDATGTPLSAKPSTELRRVHIGLPLQAYPQNHPTQSARAQL
jgi:hypothetical protein